jgi:hypothetical protein
MEPLPSNGCLFQSSYHIILLSLTVNGQTCDLSYLSENIQLEAESRHPREITGYDNRGRKSRNTRTEQGTAARGSWHCRKEGRFSPSTSVSPANLHSTNCSTITLIYHRGLYNRPEVAAVPGDVSPTPIVIKKKFLNYGVQPESPPAVQSEGFWVA